MFRKRVFTAMVGIPVMLLSVYWGGIWLAALVVAVGVLCVVEFGRMAKTADRGPAIDSLVLPTIAFILQAYLDPHNTRGSGALAFTAVAVMYVLIRELARWAALHKTATGVTHSAGYLGNTSTALMASLYAGWLFGHMLRLRQLTDGMSLTFLLLVSVWASDSFAYFIGTWVGRKRIWPTISPAKSVEGAFAGMVGAGLVSALAAGGFGLETGFGVIFGLVASIAGLAGDLVESGFKRDAGVKDSGKLLPGHGGMMDRFDSLIFASVATYYLVSFFPGPR